MAPRQPIESVHDPSSSKCDSSTRTELRNHQTRRGSPSWRRFPRFPSRREPGASHHQREAASSRPRPAKAGWWFPAVDCRDLSGSDSDSRTWRPRTGSPHGPRCSWPTSQPSWSRNGFAWGWTDLRNSHAPDLMSRNRFPRQRKIESSPETKEVTKNQNRTTKVSFRQPRFFVGSDS